MYNVTGPVFSCKLRHIVGFGLVEMAISTNPKPTISRKLYENMGPETEAAQSLCFAPLIFKPFVFIETLYGNMQTMLDSKGIPYIILS